MGPQQAVGYALALTVCALSVGGCITPRLLEPAAADRAVVVTIEDFSDWLRANSIELAAEAETLTKQKIAWSYQLTYEFRGVDADYAGEPLRVALHSEVSVHPNAPSARHNANTYGLGLAAGIRQGGGSLERVAPTLQWGDAVDSFTIHRNGHQIGNLFIGRSGRVATYVMISGIYASEPARFEALLAPKLRVVERYDPVPAADGRGE